VGIVRFTLIRVVPCSNVDCFNCYLDRDLWFFSVSTGEFRNERVKLSLCLIKYHSLNRYKCKRVEVKLHAFLTSALNGGERSASHPGCYTPR
jgi:hypothetical protein